MNPTWIHVGVLYAIGVWLARRSGVALPRRIAFFFYALVLVFLFRPMTQAYVDMPVDCVTRIPPWSLVDRAPTVNCEMNDIVTQMVPWAGEVRDDWRSLRFPLWSARSGSGSVLLANAQSAALSPLRLLALPLPLGESMTAEAAMKLLIALTFAFLFCRRRGWSDIAAAAGAVAYGFCMFLVVWLHFGHATVAADLPAVVLMIDLLAERVTPARFAVAVAVWVALIFGGHPETALHIFVFALLMVVWMAFVERSVKTRSLLALAGVMVVAVLVASPLVAPFAEAVTKSDRLQKVREAPPAIPFTDRASAVLLIQPSFYGTRPVEPAWGPATAETLTAFAGILGFVGWIALLLDAIRTRRWRTRAMFFVIVTPLLLGIILNWPVIGPGFHAVFSFAANARMRLLFAFVMAIQAAAAIDLIERGRRGVVLIGVAAVAMFLLVLIASFDFPQSAIRGVVPSAAVLAVAAFATVPRFRAAATIVLLVAIVVEVWSPSIRWNPVVGDERMYPPAPLIRKLQALQTGEPHRIVGLGSILYPNTGSIYGFEDIRTHDPMANARYLGVLRVLTGYNTEEYFAHWQNADSRMLDFLNVKYVVTDPGADLADRQRYELVYDGRDGRIYRNRDVLPRFFAVRNVVLEFKGFAYAQRLATMTDFNMTGIVKNLPVVSDRMRNDLLAPRPPDAPEPLLTLIEAGGSDFRLRVQAPRYALVVSSQPFWPGWRVRVNGKRAEPLVVNGAFLGFTVPPGDSEVRVDYYPATFYAALAVSVIAVAAGIAVAAKLKR